MNGSAVWRTLLICVVKAATMAPVECTADILLFGRLAGGRDGVCMGSVVCAAAATLRCQRRRNANGRSGGFSRLRPDGV